MCDNCFKLQQQIDRKDTHHVNVVLAVSELAKAVRLSRKRRAQSVLVIIHDVTVAVKKLRAAKQAVK